MPVTTSNDPRPDVQQGDGEVVSARRARQGFRDRPILYVLLASMALVAVAFVIAFLTNNNQESAADRGMARTDDPAAAAAFDAPAPAPKVVPSN